jgi:hypothetical protein
VNDWIKMLTTAVISIIVGVVSALVVDFFRASASKLEYQTLSAASFTGQVQKIGMAAIDVKNTGRQVLELVSVSIQIPGATLLDSRTEGLPTKGLVETRTNDTYIAELPFLNPSESGRIALLANLENAKSAMPVIELRAKGILGKQASPERSDRFAITLITTALMTLVAFIILEVWQWKRWALAEEDKRDVMGFILDITGLPEEAEKLRLYHRQPSYWAIGDWLTERALRSTDSERLKKVCRSLQHLIENRFIASSSKAMLGCDLARMYRQLGELENAKASLAAAGTKNRRIVEDRIRLTPDLQELLPAITFRQSR